MGGQYKITGHKYPRMRRPRRRGRLVFLTVASVAVLGVIGWGTLQLIDVFTGGGKKAVAAGTKGDCTSKAAGLASAPSPSATSLARTLPKPGQVTVNVLNATTRKGLAQQTADELKKRGFHIGQVGNATKAFDKKVKGSGVLLGPASSLNTSLPVLATQLTGADLRTDTRRGTDVDLIIGTGFKGLNQQAAANDALTALSAPRPSATTIKKRC
ncbi:LytR C-terminal domain-containing protein [Streptomyces sp. NPDC020801]|uniref:LytR C-terminal domain-containing protein n=1 Tax=unclassified Streptomyces TaxID=2593676 RepID=UPI0037AF41AA